MQHHDTCTFFCAYYFEKWHGKWQACACYCYESLLYCLRLLWKAQLQPSQEDGCHRKMISAQYMHHPLIVETGTWASSVA
ncbi:unnamed protein product, partial [Ixodes persulcatus]